VPLGTIARTIRGTIARTIRDKLKR
jgi:hypothetical protein